MDKFALTLYDYKPELQWVQMLDWTDEELQSVPVHEQFTAEGPFLNLANFGGTPLGVMSAGEGGPTSAGARSLKNLYVYQNDTPETLYRRLDDLLARGGPSVYERGEFGEIGEAENFPGSEDISGPEDYSSFEI